MRGGGDDVTPTHRRPMESEWAVGVGGGEGQVAAVVVQDRFFVGGFSGWHNMGCREEGNIIGVV